MLCERGETQAVVQLPYGELQGDVRSTLLARVWFWGKLETVSYLCSPSYFSGNDLTPIFCRSCFFPVLLRQAVSGDVLDVVMGHNTNFYELLYAFNIFHGDMRAAAEIMHSLAKRLSTEHFAMDDERAVVCLESQRDAYLGQYQSLLSAQDYTK